MPLLRRALILTFAVLLSVVPGWSAARAVAAACASLDRAAESVPADAFEDEEALEIASLTRAGVEVRCDAARRDERVAATPASLRHIAEWQSALAEQRWTAYRPPPRAPPHRLLN